jgi:hypothetical protein
MTDRQERHHLLPRRWTPLSRLTIGVRLHVALIRVRIPGAGKHFQGHSWTALIHGIQLERRRLCKQARHWHNEA